jgi:hypothetical protein
MWGNTTDSISALPYRDAILILFSAPSLDAKFQIIRKNFAVLTSHATLDALEEDIERSWNQGDRTMADFLWQMQQLLRRVREQGLDTTVEVYGQSIEHVQDITVLLERSSTPYQTWIGVFALLDAVESGDEQAILYTLIEFEEQFRQPLATVLARTMSAVPAEVLGIGSAHYSDAIQMLESLACGQDLQAVISTRHPSKRESLQEMGEPNRTIAKYLMAASKDWYAAQQFVKRNYNLLLSNASLDTLRRAMRDAWQSDRDLGEQMWRRLRLLEYARKRGVDVAFDMLIWNHNAEQIWQSDHEVGMMEAANVPLNDLDGLWKLIIALESGDKQELHQWEERYWDDIQPLWVANYVRYMADVFEIEGLSSRERWDSLADWLDSIRGDNFHRSPSQNRWGNPPDVEGLTLL